MTSKQLFRVLRDFDLPIAIDRIAESGKYLVKFEKCEAAIALCWPNGRPCCIAEMYILDRADQYTTRRLDGGSLRVIASHLSLLLRYAYHAQVALKDFDDFHMQQAIRQLAEERRSPTSAELRRDNNTSRKIISSWIAFFEWMQEQLQCSSAIVGPQAINPKIPLQLKKSIGKHGKPVVSWQYRYAPPPVTREDIRGPIARDLRVKLWEATVLMGRTSNIDKPSGQSSLHVKEKQAVVDKYVLKRRQLILSLLEGTGARPGELARLSVEKNRQPVRESKLILRTLKRRKAIDPERMIPIDRSIAMRIEIFTDRYRAALIDELRSNGTHVETGDHLLLTSRGAPLTEAALEREFSRLVKAAGIGDERACMSMFRHRFITNMVKLHLQEFMRDHPEKGVRALFTEADHRTILRRVATFTGHGDESSLFPYIDLAWEEVGIFDYVASARALIDAVEISIDHLSGLIAQTSLIRSAAPANAAQIIKELEAIRQSTLDALGFKQQHTEKPV